MLNTWVELTPRLCDTLMASTNSIYVVSHLSTVNFSTVLVESSLKWRLKVHKFHTLMEEKKFRGSLNSREQRDFLSFAHIKTGLASYVNECNVM